MAELNFDANKVNPMRDLEPVPAGKYMAIIEASETKDTAAGTGSYLELTFQIIDGEFKGQKVWSRLNLDNPSAQAVEISNAELSTICRACGVMTPKDSAELHDKPMQISVGLRKYTDNNGEEKFSNVIKGYTKPDDATFPQGTESDIPFDKF